MYSYLSSARDLLLNFHRAFSTSV